MEKRKIGMTVTSVLLGGILAFSIYASTFADDVEVTHSAAYASSANAAATISANGPAPLEAVARMTNGMGWVGESRSEYTSSLTAGASASDFNYPGIPTQVARASVAFKGVTWAEDYWPK